MRRYSFGEVSRLDDDLYQLALYAVTEGKIVVPNNKEELYALQKKIAHKFNYFKDIIHNGECSFDFIEDDILSTYGPFAQNEEDDFNYDSITKYIREQDEIDAEQELKQKTSDVIKKLLVSFLDYEQRLDDMGYDIEGYDIDHQEPPFEDEEDIKE